MIPFSRVAITPTVTEALVKKGFTINVEEDAGKEAKFRNIDYEQAGAKLVSTQNAFDSGKFLTAIFKETKLC